jgi:molybdopterin converting factor subunit 1
VKSIAVQYFALLRDQAGRAEEKLATEAATPAALFDELSARHRFTLPRSVLRVALNDEFARWDQSLREGDRVAFIPPVAGG